MTTTTAPKNGAGVAEGAAPTPAPEGRSRDKTLNIHERKLAVMARVGEIHHDKTHPHHNYTYNSIDNISNAIRALFVEFGIGYEPSCSDGVMTVRLVNVDRPDDTSTTTWPVVDDDKGFAYSTKFPLVRTFLVADSAEDDPAKSGEADESHMAANSAHAGATTRPAPAPPARTTGTGAQPLGPCPECAEEGITAASGKPSAYWPPRKPGHQPQCNGYRDGVYMNHQMRPVATGQPQQTFADGTPIPDEIPF